MANTPSVSIQATILIDQVLQAAVAGVGIRTATARKRLEQYIAALEAGDPAGADGPGPAPPLPLSRGKSKKGR